MSASVMIPLILVVLYNGKSLSRAIPCLIVALVTLAQYQVYQSEAYFLIQDQIGYFGYTALTPLITICLLGLFTNRYVMQSKLARCLMVLFTLYIGVIISCGWMEGIGLGSQVFLGWIELLVYMAELALMCSTKLTDQMAGGLKAVYGNIRRHATSRGASAPNHPFYHRNNRGHNNMDGSH